MPRIGRLLLLGAAVPMMLFSHFSFGREVQKSNCSAALAENLNLKSDMQIVDEPQSRRRIPRDRFAYENTTWYSQILNEEFAAAPYPEERGMDMVTDENMRRWTQGSGLAVFVIDPNPHAHRYMRHPDHHAKPSYLKKCKSLSDGPESARGLVACHPMFFDTEEDWKNTKEDLSKRNLYVDEDNYYLVYSLTPSGEKKYFFSDIDLFAVFKMRQDGARPFFRNRLINQINRAIDLDHKRGIQHGPRQDYHGKADLGFKFPITAYIPGVKKPIHLRDVCDLKKLYGILNLSLEEIWGDYFAKASAQSCSGK